MDHKAPAPRPAAPGDSEAERPSKSQRKREMTALQALGESLLRLSAAELARIDLPEPMRDALTETAGIRSHEGRRRHLQYIGSEGQPSGTQQPETPAKITGAIARDLNNLLTAILANVGFVMDAGESIPAEARADLQEIRDAVLRGAVMVRKLMALSRQA